MTPCDTAGATRRAQILLVFAIFAASIDAAVAACTGHEAIFVNTPWDGSPVTDGAADAGHRRRS